MLIIRNYAQPTLYPRTITKSEQKQKPEYVSGAKIFKTLRSVSFAISLKSYMRPVRFLWQIMR